MLDDWLAADRRARRGAVHLSRLSAHRAEPPRHVWDRASVSRPKVWLSDQSSIAWSRHYLWGQMHVEFVYSTWQRIGGAHLPAGTFRVEDGVTTITRTYGEQRLVPRDSAPSLTLPARDKPMALARQISSCRRRPDTDPRERDDCSASQSRLCRDRDARARHRVRVRRDAGRRARAARFARGSPRSFPGRHPIVVVVTDLAWPHVAGVRAWVARGATIVSHRAAREFLARSRGQTVDAVARSARAASRPRHVPLPRRGRLADARRRRHPALSHRRRGERGGPRRVRATRPVPVGERLPSEREARRPNISTTCSPRSSAPACRRSRSRRSTRRSSSGNASRHSPSVQPRPEPSRGIRRNTRPRRR